MRSLVLRAANSEKVTTARSARVIDVNNFLTCIKFKFDTCTCQLFTLRDLGLMEAVVPLTRLT